MVVDAYDLVGWLWDRVEKFPRNTKPVLGRQVEEASLELLLLLVRATYLRNPVALLDEANLIVEKLRWLVRLAKDRKYLSLKQYEHAAKQIDNVGRQIGGWRKSETPSHP